MKRYFRPFLALTQASLKMYYRNRGAIFFTILFPLALMSIFGFLSKGGAANTIKIHITNYSTSEVATTLVENLKKEERFSIVEGADSVGLAELSKGHTDLQMIIPSEFGTFEEEAPVAATIHTRYNSARAFAGQIANMIIKEIIRNIEANITHIPAVLSVDTEAVESQRQSYFDFVLPGLLSMTIMQLGIFGVAFSFVSLKASGALRRIQATPVPPIHFVFAQVVVRLLVAFGSTALLLALGTYFFDFHMNGSYITFTVVIVFGIIAFLGIGFGIAGWAREETQVAPLANLIQLPMLLLSGIFFSRDGFPGWLKTITDYFPLTYLSDGLRKIANEGAGLLDIPGDLIGLIVWIAIIYAITVKLFRWE